MRKSYRINQEALYAAALKGVRVTVRKVTVHLDASATVKGDERVVNAVKRLPGVEVLSVGGGEITFRIPAAVEYDAEHKPRLTDAEKAQIAAEKAARKAARDAKRAAAQVDDDASADDETEVDEE